MFKSMMNFSFSKALMLIFLLFQFFAASSGRPECGRTPIPPIETPNDANIIGGIVAKPFSWPWHAALFDGSSGFDGCSGSVIADRWIMTAAHCTSTNLGQVRVGVFNCTERKVPGEQIIKITAVLVHPGWNEWDNDIALLKLERPIVFSDHVQPVCLPAEVDQVAVDGDQLYATGWGARNHPHKDDYRLRQVTVPLVGNEECAKDYPGRETHFNPDCMICAGNKGHDTCQGDSGGPLVRKNNESGKWYQVGITSWGEGCALEKKPGVYTNVAHFCDFIESVVGHNLCQLL